MALFGNNIETAADNTDAKSPEAELEEILKKILLESKDIYKLELEKIDEDAKETEAVIKNHKQKINDLKIEKNSLETRISTLGKHVEDLDSKKKNFTNDKEKIANKISTDVNQRIGSVLGTHSSVKICIGCLKLFDANFTSQSSSSFNFGGSTFPQDLPAQNNARRKKITRNSPESSSGSSFCFGGSSNGSFSQQKAQENSTSAAYCKNCPLNSI